MLLTLFLSGSCILYRVNIIKKEFLISVLWRIKTIAMIPFKISFSHNSQLLDISPPTYCWIPSKTISLLSFKKSLLSQCNMALDSFWYLWPIFLQVDINFKSWISCMVYQSLDKGTWIEATICIIAVTRPFIFNWSTRSWSLLLSLCCLTYRDVLYISPSRYSPLMSFTLLFILLPCFCWVIY